MKQLKRISFLGLLIGSTFLQMCGMETTVYKAVRKDTLLNPRELPPIIFDNYLITHNDLQSVLKRGIEEASSGKYQTQKNNQQSSEKLINIAHYNAATQTVLEAQVGWYQEVLQKKDVSFEIEQPVGQITPCKELPVFKKVNQNDLILLSSQTELLKNGTKVFDACQVKKTTGHDGQEKKITDLSSLHPILTNYNPEIKRLAGELNDLRSKFVALKKENEKQRIMRSHQNPRFIDHVNELIGDEPWRDAPAEPKKQTSWFSSKLGGLFAIKRLFSKAKMLFPANQKTARTQSSTAKDDLD